MDANKLLGQVTHFETHCWGMGKKETMLLVHLGKLLRYWLYILAVDLQKHHLLALGCLLGDKYTPTDTTSFLDCVSLKAYQDLVHPKCRQKSKYKPRSKDRRTQPFFLKQPVESVKAFRAFEALQLFATVSFLIN